MTLADEDINTIFANNANYDVVVGDYLNLLVMMHQDQDRCGIENCHHHHHQG